MTTASRRSVRRFRPIACVACSLILAASLGARAGAQEHGEEHHSEAEAAEHEFHRHHAAVFLGVTDGEVEKEAEVGVESDGESVVVEDQRAFTLGLEYVYRLTRLWGVGAVIEFAGKDFRAGVVSAPVVLHPKPGWKLYLGPGFEKNREHDAEFLVRAGVLYDFEIGRFTLAPAINIDLVGDDTILVYGVNIGRGF